MATYYDLKPSYKDSSGDIHTIPTYAVDTVLNTESNNAIANSTVATALQGLQTATGNPATITNAAPINAQSVRVAIEAVQEGSGTPSPDNIRPIVGWDAVNVTRCGKNLVESTITAAQLNENGVIKGMSTDGYHMHIAKVKEGQTYTFSTDGDWTVYGFFESFPTIGSVSYNNSRAVTLTGLTVTAPITGYMAYRAKANYTTPQLEIGSTATTYEPYNGTTYTKSLSTTNYGGYWDATEGVIGTTHAIVDLSSLSWSGRATGSVHKLFSTSLPNNYNTGADIEMESDRYAYIGASSAATLIGSVDTAEIGLYSFANETITDVLYLVTDLTLTSTSLQGQVLYKIATPTTSSTTPEEIPLSQGTNNLWSDTGDVTVKFWSNNVIGQLVGLIQQSQS